MASIRERPLKTGGSTWAVLYRHGHTQASKAFETQEAAEDFKVLIDRFGPDRALKMHAQDTEPEGVTVRTLAERWLESKARDLTPRALADYERDYFNWIDPFFGHRSAAYVNEIDVQEWVDRDLVRKLGPKSVADKHAILYGIFKFASARTRQFVPHNPCQETQLPKRVKSQPKGLTHPEWLALKEAAYRLDEDAADLILFLGSTGWRIGEATALMVRNVEDDGKIWVTVSHVNRKGAGVVAGAKSDAAYRRIDLSREAGAMIRRRLVGLGVNDYVFTNPASPTGLWEPSTFRRRYWAAAVKLAGLEAPRQNRRWIWPAA
ncbi:MAG: tyrosine-type recombinase/integrase [Isosphaeraceae bacterium]